MADYKTCNVDGLRATVAMILKFLGIEETVMNDGLCPLCRHYEVVATEEPCFGCNEWDKFERSAHDDRT